MRATEQLCSAREAVLLAATRGNAGILGIAGGVGSLAPGMTADMVLLGTNPLDGLAALRDVRRVIRAGVVNGPAALRT